MPYPMLTSIPLLCTRIRNVLKAHGPFRLCITAIDLTRAQAVTTLPRCIPVLNLTDSRPALRYLARQAKITDNQLISMPHHQYRLQLRGHRRRLNRRVRAVVRQIRRYRLQQSIHTELRPSIPTTQIRRTRTRYRSRNTKFWKCQMFQGAGGKRGNKMGRRVLHLQTI